MSIKENIRNTALLIPFVLTGCKAQPSISFTESQINDAITGSGLATARVTYYAPVTQTAVAEEQKVNATQTAISDPSLLEIGGASKNCIMITEGDTFWKIQQNGYFTTEGDIYNCKKPGNDCDKHTQENPPTFIKPGQYLCEPKQSGFLAGNPYHHPSTPVPTKTR